MIERFCRVVECERSNRSEIADRLALAAEAGNRRPIHNSIRPRETIAMPQPLERRRQTPRPNPPDRESVSNPRHRTESRGLSPSEV